MANNVWEAIGEQMRANEREEVFQEGYKEGYQEGYQEGLEEGREVLRSEISQTVAYRFNERSGDLNALVKRVRDLKQLCAILRFASFGAKSADEVTGYVKSVLSSDNSVDVLID